MNDSATTTGARLLPPLRLGSPSNPDSLVVDTPVILAPMAGVTNAAYRQLCREQGAGLYVCEMITARGLVGVVAAVAAGVLLGAA